VHEKLPSFSSLPLTRETTKREAGGEGLFTSLLSNLVVVSETINPSEISIRGYKKGSAVFSRSMLV
jgi:hypothetical protein